MAVHVIIIKQEAILIQLQVDYTLLNRFFGIPASKIPMYANKDFQEIMEIEAQQGNQKAADYKKILSDPDKILEIFNIWIYYRHNAPKSN